MQKATADATVGRQAANKTSEATEAANRRVSQTSSRTRNMASASRATSGSSSVGISPHLIHRVLELDLILKGVKI